MSHHENHQSMDRSQQNTHGTVCDGICYMDYTGLKWKNIDQFWYRYTKYDLKADTCNHNTRTID